VDVLLSLLHLRKRDGTVCRQRHSIERYLEDAQECFNSTTGRHAMPSFTFEKLSQPIRRGRPPAIEQKQRGVLAALLDRVAEARVKRRLRKEKGVVPRRQTKPQD
jgi:hypothetical protein